MLQESFWDAESFAVITDGTKPAMRWTVNELKRLGKKIHIVDISSPEKLHALSQLPEEMDHAIIGVTTIEPADIMDELEKKGVKKFWIHWRTDTPEVKRRCSRLRMHCVIGRCPVMYLSSGFNIHTLHKAMAKLMRRY